MSICHIYRDRIQTKNCNKLSVWGCIQMINKHNYLYIPSGSLCIRYYLIILINDCINTYDFIYIVILLQLQHIYFTDLLTICNIMFNKY